MLKRIKYICLLGLLSSILLLGCAKDKSTSTSDSKEGTVEKASQTSAYTLSYVEYFSIDDAIDITGLSELKLKENGTILQFYIGEEANIALEVSFRDGSFYEVEVGDGEYYTELNDVADKAAIAIPDAPYRVTLLKGDTTVMVQTIPQDSSLKLSKEQLIEASKLVASRLE